jgi:hypothetical protein
MRSVRSQLEGHRPEHLAGPSDKSQRTLVAQYLTALEADDVVGLAALSQPHLGN